MTRRSATHAALLLVTWLPAATPLAIAAERGCGQSLVDFSTPPAATAMITPRTPVTPFYQWTGNDGYCGEVAMIQAGLARGQYLSQYNARALCGTGLAQAGAGSSCAIHGQPNYNAQYLLETPGQGFSGPRTFANAAQCDANARLAATTYNSEKQPAGIAGYQQYMSWVKAQVIAGNHVTVGVLMAGGSAPQYDHEVSVLRIGTNHSPTDPTYYADDVLYFDDHGLYTLEGSQFTGNPAIPPGAGSDTTGCTPYIFGYRFAALAQTRATANSPGALAYSIVIPATAPMQTYTGGTGYAPVNVHGPHDFAISVSGPTDPEAETLPVKLTIAAPTKTYGVANPPDPIAGYNYENPAADYCSNTRPQPMSSVILRATVTGLTPGQGYNLYEYDIPTIHGTGAAAALAVPTQNFNANASLATKTIGFTALADNFTTTVATTSSHTIVFRAVLAGAP